MFVLVRVGLCYVRVGLCYARVGSCYARVGLCYIRVGLCYVRVTGSNILWFHGRTRTAAEVPFAKTVTFQSSFFY